MSYAIEKTVQSLRDVEEAFVYIAEGDLDSALRFLVAIEKTIELIAEHPLIGSNRAFEHLKLKDVRLWPVSDFDNYLIFYQPNEKRKTVTFLRMLNAKRDFYLIFD